jgi:hypothetical protein
MRGVAFADGYHDMTIREGEGVVVFPRIVPGSVTEVATAGNRLSKRRPLASDLSNSYFRTFSSPRQHSRRHRACE